MKTKNEKIKVHITSARGPVECELAVAKVLAQLLTEGRNVGLEIEVLHRQAGQENGSLSSATLSCFGVNCRDFLQPWMGTILWIQKSPYRPNHGRKNWYIGVVEIPENQQLNWTEKELVFQAVRSSGAGGQHVNKVSSAVRVTHEPTGITVFVQDSRSQQHNRKLALLRIAEKLQQHANAQLMDQANKQWLQNITLERGNPVKVFEGTLMKEKRPDKTFASKRQALKQALQKELKH